MERRIAKALGGKRIPLSGRNNMGKVGDVEIAGWAIEAKSGRQVPVTVMRWLDAIREARKADDFPVLVMQPYRKKERVVVIAESDFVLIVEHMGRLRESRNQNVGEARSGDGSAW